MTSESADTRDRVRALVREVLDSVPVDDAAPSPDQAPEHIVVNSLREKTEREFDRDESAKSLITEDDLRGLDFGSRIRVSETAKFTPLAADIVTERGIVLIHKKSRTEGLKVRSVAIGADHGGNFGGNGREAPHCLVSCFPSGIGSPTICNHVQSNARIQQLEYA